VTLVVGPPGSGKTQLVEVRRLAAGEDPAPPARD
jgi:Ni2+-binding GTPase involved in maturation of urease and hydrogenase